MSDKERLERIKQYYSCMNVLEPDLQEDIKCLINRVEELEKENRRYKQALEEIIRQHELEDEIDDYDFMWNVKQIARQALEGEE